MFLGYSYFSLKVYVLNMDYKTKTLLYSNKFKHHQVTCYLLRLRYTGGWKPFCDPQKFIFDSIMNMRYVIIDKCKMAFIVKARL